MFALTKSRGFLTRRGIVIGVLLMLASACQTQSPAVQLQKATQRIISYGATAQMTLEALQNSKVTRAFATTTVTAMQQNIATEVETIQSLELPAENKQPLIESSNQLQTTLTNVHESLQKGDFAGINSAVSQLTTSNQKLENLAHGEAIEK